MLTHITLSHYRIVEQLTLDIHPGFSVITGETGAGKSLLLGALQLAMGARADANTIRSGSKKCDISVCFDVSNIPDANTWLMDNDLDDDNDCIIRRTLHHNGKSRSTLNGTPISQSQLREFSALLFHLHSQHFHQALQKPTAQRQCLDAYANNNALLEKIATLYHAYCERQHTIDQLLANNSNRDDELSLLHYQQNELSALHVEEGEWEQLHKQHQTHHQSKSLLAHLNAAVDATADSGRQSAADLLEQAIIQLESIATPETQIQEALSLLKTASIHAKEAGSTLLHYRDHLDLNPEALATIESRLSALHDCARKHHVNPEALHTVANSLAEKINTLDNAEARIQTLQDEQAACLSEYQNLATQLTAARKKAATTLSNKITKAMQTLGMPGGTFSVQLNPISDNIALTGLEKIQFMVMTNPGQPAGELQKVASGGELSRISLALDVARCDKTQTPTLIFDEVDVGIGGSTAEVVGEQLATLAKSAQVLCITHLAQVASKGTHHILVKKGVTQGETFAELVPLNESERIEELARMLGGRDISKAHREGAKAMLA